VAQFCPVLTGDFLKVAFHFASVAGLESLLHGSSLLVLCFWNTVLVPARWEGANKTGRGREKFV